jgi:hypothetical protein
MFLLSCAFAVLLTLRSGNIGSIIRNIEIAEILDGTEYSYYLVHQINGLPFHDAQVSIYDIEEFIKSDAVSREIGGVMDGYLRAFAQGDLDYYLTADEIIRISRSLEPEFNDLFDHRMTEADHERLARTIDDIVDFRGLRVGDIIDDIGIDIDTYIDTTILYLLVSSYLLWGVGFLCVLTLGLIFLHHRRRVADAFRFAGIPIMLSGLLYLITGVVLGSYQELPGDALHSFAGLTGGLADLVIRHGVVFAAAGLLSVIISFFFSRRVI